MLRSVFGGVAAVALLAAGSAQGAQLFAVSASGQLKGFTANPGLAETHNFTPFGAGAANLSVGAFANGDGRVDLAVGSGDGSVRVFDTLSLTPTAEFRPFEGYTGGVRVAVGDVNGDGRADLVVGAGAGLPQVKVFEGGAMGFTETRSFNAFGGSVDGVSVALGESDDGRATLIVGSGDGRHVTVFDYLTHTALHDFDAFDGYDPQFAGGVNVAYARLGGQNVFLVGQGDGGGHVEVYSLSRAGGLLHGLDPFGTDFRGGVFVGGGTFGGQDSFLFGGGGNLQALSFGGRAPSSFNFSPFDGEAFALAGTFDAVPEPTTWALMILGFGAAGAGLRRRRVDA